MSVMRHRRTNATSLIVIVASSFVAQDPLMTAVRALGVLGYQVLMTSHSTTDMEQSFLRHSNIRCRCLSRVSHGGMSALSPFYPQLRTLVGATGTAASCHDDRTSNFH